MGRFKRLRPTYAGVTATAALVVALGMGGAYASAHIGSKDIAPNAVKSKHIKDLQVKTPDLGPNAVTSDKIADGQVNGFDVSLGSLNGAQLQDGGIFSADLATNSVAGDELVDGGIQAADIDGNAVGGSELKDLFSVVGSGVQLGAGQAGGTFVTCPQNAVALSGGAAWVNDGASSIVYSVPDETDQRTWVVRGIPASTNTLHAWARCLPV